MKDFQLPQHSQSVFPRIGVVPSRWAFLTTPSERASHTVALRTSPPHTTVSRGLRARNAEMGAHTKDSHLPHPFSECFFFRIGVVPARKNYPSNNLERLCRYVSLRIQIGDREPRTIPIKDLPLRVVFFWEGGVVCDLSEPKKMTKYAPPPVLHSRC